MKYNKIFSLKNLKIITISAIILDLAFAVISPLLSKCCAPTTVLLLSILYSYLIPITGFLMIITFVFNMQASYKEKRTTKQELVVRQKFWGRIALITISGIITFISSLFTNWSFLIMFVLFALSIYYGPAFGRAVIKK